MSADHRNRRVGLGSATWLTNHKQNEFPPRQFWPRSCFKHAQYWVGDGAGNGRFFREQWRDAWGADQGDGWGSGFGTYRDQLGGGNSMYSTGDGDGQSAEQ